MTEPEYLATMARIDVLMDLERMSIEQRNEFLDLCERALAYEQEHFQLENALD